MASATDLGTSLAILEGLRETHGIHPRLTGWTSGWQCGAYVMTATGWRGDSGPWRATAWDALEDGLQIAERLKAQIDAERVEKKETE